MPWTSVSLLVPAARAEFLTDALLEQGAVSVDVSDAAAGTEWERPIFDEPDAPLATGWETGLVSALFPMECAVDAAVPAALVAAGLPGTTPFQVDRVDDQDWVRLTQSQFQPIHVEGPLWIVPTWHTAPDPGAINISLDPGIAFGTGSHPTTRLCLRWLARHVRGGESVIDFGCGSGILAIAAMKLGAATVSGVDIDPQAVVAARRNAMQNGVVADFHEAADRLTGNAQMVVANILANPLIVLAPVLAGLTAPCGSVVLSGVLEEQAAEVAGVYGRWFDMETPITEDGWILLVGRKR
jgi:ribosomal protein L11 methyltransferase